MESFEDLILWQQTRDLIRAIYQLTQQRVFAADFGLARLNQRVAVTTMSNSAEGVERSDRREFHQRLSTAKGSSGEAVGRVVGDLRATVEKLRDERRSAS